MRIRPACVLAAAALLVSCASVTMIGDVSAHGDLHGLSGSEIEAAISSWHATGPKAEITDVVVVSAREVHLYSDNYGSDYARYIIMRRVGKKWIYAGQMIVTA